MIRALRIGKLEKIPAIIELVDNKEVLLERSQLNPFFHSEELAFTPEGLVTRIYYEQDIIIGEDYPRSKYSLDLHHRQGLIKCEGCSPEKEIVLHRIEEAYENASKFRETVRKLKVPQKNKKLRDEVLDDLDNIIGYNFMHVLLYKIE